MNYDIAIIGGGPAGYPAAIKASKLGMKVVIIEKEDLGGVCLNWGCIPTKSLLHVAEKYLFIKNHAKKLGIKCTGVDLNFDDAISYSRSVVAKLSSGIKYLLEKNKIEVIKGSAVLDSSGAVLLTNLDKKIKAKNIIIATGASPRQIKGLEFDHDIVWDYKDAMVPKLMPKSILIVGSGAIGIEYACIYNAFGCKVAVVEMQDRILQSEDEEISKIAHDIFIKNGINIQTGVTVTDLKKNQKSAQVTLSNNKILNVDRVLVAAGVRPNSSRLGLESIPQIDIRDGFIKTDRNFKTGKDGIYAVGDVSGTPCLAHRATFEAMLCIDKIAGKDIHKFKAQDIPSCIYSIPQIASIGLTESQAKENGYKIKVGRSRASANGKSVATGKAEGLVKTIFDKASGELLGAHMIGADVTEMLQGFIIAKNSESTDECLKNTIFPHPTMSEMMYESVLAADGEEIHS